ncbi:hypothetical protein [Parapedobacter sp. 2B3]|uniref:hypothetical protein n=1 Tax=Parapedobacter sp. 2B3 TaxID=3342381 RepID=UPI0035B6932F
MFILIVASWNTGEKNAFDDTWGIKPRNRLSKYIASYDDWEEVYDRPFRDYNILTGNKYISEFDKIEIAIDQPYKTRYLFYVLSKRSDINQE